jgi:hypothetical protein
LDTYFDRVDIKFLFVRIDHEENPIVTTTIVVRHPDEHGYVSKEYHVLGRLLNALKELDFLDQNDFLLLIGFLENTI